MLRAIVCGMHCGARLAALLALIVSAASCISPTLPLPPPTVDGESEGSSGLWELTGSCTGGSWVYALNATSQARGESDQGAFVTCSQSGSYALEVAGKICDVVNVWESLTDGSNESATQSVLLIPTVDDVPTTPNACR